MNRIIRKLSLSATAVAIVVMAVPAISSAAQLWEEGTPDELVQVGRTITGVSNNFVWSNTALGTLTCDTVAIEQEVSENSGSTVAIEGVNYGAGSSCEASGLPMSLTDVDLVYASATGAGPGWLGISFVVTVGSFRCTYEGEGEFTYGSGPGSKLEIADIELGSPAELCEPEEGHVHLSGDFALSRTRTGAPVYFTE